MHRYARRLRTDHGVLAIAFAYILADYARREACAIEAGMWKAVEEHIAASLHRQEPGLTDVSPRAGEPRPRPAPPGPVEAPFAPSTA